MKLSLPTFLITLVAAANMLPTAANAQTFCPGTELTVRTGPGRSVPSVSVRLENRTGPFKLDYHQGYTSLDREAWSFAPTDERWIARGNDPRAAIRLTSFGFTGWSGVLVIFRMSRDHEDIPGVGSRLGVVGLDLLFRQNLEFHYEDPNRRRVVISSRNAPCDRSALAAAGFRLINQAGHWDTSAGAPNGVYNGPVAFIDLSDASTPAIGIGFRTWAQLDTGYEDRLLPLSVDINRAMFERLSRLRPALVELDRIRMRDCRGQWESRRVFRAPGKILRVEDAAGAEIVRVQTFRFILKGESTECLGIATTDLPAAQLGASFLRLFGTTIFLGPRREVWVRTAD